MLKKSPTCPSIGSYKDFLPGEFCFPSYYHKELFKHVVKCQFTPKDAGRSHQVKSTSIMLIYQSPHACKAMNSVLNRMNVDEDSQCVKSDNLLIKYGNVLCKKYWNNGNQ